MAQETNNYQNHGPDVALVLAGAPGAIIELPGTSGQDSSVRVTVDGSAIVEGAADYVGKNIIDPVVTRAGVGHAAVRGLDSSGSIITVRSLNGKPSSVSAETRIS